MGEYPFELPWAERCAGVAVDVQPGLLKAYPEARRRQVMTRCRLAAGALAALEMPLAVLELDPERFGRADPELVQAAGPRVVVLPKYGYDAWADPDFSLWIRSSGRPWIVLFGVETHVCVLQAAFSLVGAGFQVAWLRDATFSRDPVDQETGEHLLRRGGVLPLTTETLVFATLKDRRYSAFERVFPWLKARVWHGGTGGDT